MAFDAEPQGGGGGDSPPMVVLIHTKRCELIGVVPFAMSIALRIAKDGARPDHGCVMHADGSFSRAEFNLPDDVPCEPGDVIVFNMGAV